MAAFATTAQSEQPADVFSVTTCSYPSAQCGRVQCNSSGRTERGRARSHGCRARSQLREGPRGPVARSALRDCALRPHEARRRPSREVLLRPQTSAATSSCVQDPFVLRIAPECPKARDMPEEQVEACAESFISDLLADAMNDFVDEQVYDLADDPVDGGSTYGLAEPVINAGEPMILECEEGQEMEWPAYIPAMMPLGAPVCDSPMWSQSGCCGDIDYSCGIKADVALQTGGEVMAVVALVLALVAVAAVAAVAAAAAMAVLVVGEMAAVAEVEVVVVKMIARSVTLKMFSVFAPVRILGTSATTS